MSGHVCDSGNFDRTLCPEPCGSMHSYCGTCGKRQDRCAHDTSISREFRTQWGVRRTWGDVGSVADFEGDRRTAENCAREWPGNLVSRTVTFGEWTTAAPATATATDPEARRPYPACELHGDGGAA